MTQISTSKAFVTAREAWLFDLRSACLVLSEKPAHVVSAISMTQRFADLEATERDQLVLLAGNMAGEYGLRAEVSDASRWLTARLSRTSAQKSEPEAPRDGKEPAVASRRHSRLAGLLLHLKATEGIVDRALAAATTAESLEIS